MNETMLLIAEQTVQFIKNLASIMGVPFADAVGSIVGLLLEEMGPSVLQRKLDQYALARTAAEARMTVKFGPEPK